MLGLVPNQRQIFERKDIIFRMQRERTVATEDICLPTDNSECMVSRLTMLTRSNLGSSDGVSSLLISSNLKPPESALAALPIHFLNHYHCC